MLYFNLSLHSQFLNFLILGRSCLVGVDVSLSGVMETGSRRYHGLRPWSVPWTSRVPCVLLTVAALRINSAGPGFWRRYHKCQGNVLDQSCTHLCSVRPAMVCVVLLEFSSRCAFGRMLACRGDGGNNTYTNCLLIHLECIYQLMSFRNFL